MEEKTEEGDRLMSEERKKCTVNIGEDEEKCYVPVLDVASGGLEGIGWAVPNEWAEDLIDDFKLELKSRGLHGDITGEKSALFTYKGETLRLKQDWMRRFKLFKGDWKPDPHWTGD